MRDGHVVAQLRSLFVQANEGLQEIRLLRLRCTNYRRLQFRHSSAGQLKGCGHVHINTPFFFSGTAREPTSTPPNG